VLGLAAIGAGAVMAWGFQQKGLTDDGVRLATRSDAGHLLGIFLAVMIAALFAASVLLDRRAARRPLSAATRRRIGIGLVVAVALLPLAGAGLLTVSKRGFEGSITHAWDEVTDPSAAAGNGPSRLTQAGSVRGKYWNEAWQVFQQGPVIGSGAGTFSTARTHFREDTVAAHHAHGYVVQELAELGLAGAAASLFALVAWMLAAARAGGARPRVPAALARAIRRRPPPATAAGPPAPGFRSLPFTPERIAVLTLIAGVLVFGVHSLVDWTWFVPGTAVVALVAAGYVAGRGPFAEPRGGRVPGMRWGMRLGVAGALVAGALIAAWTIWQPLRSDQAGNAALGALSRNNVAAAYVNVTKARHRNPLSVDPLFIQATIEDSVGRHRAAERLLQQAVRLQPANAATWQRLGEYELNVMQRPRAAVDELRAALFLDPRLPSIQRDFVAATRALATAEQNRRGQPTTPGATPSATPGAAAPAPTPARPPAATRAPRTGGTRPNAAPKK
jgi:tetratricopeptide (TPR) repeat protein